MFNNKNHAQFLLVRIMGAHAIVRKTSGQERASAHHSSLISHQAGDGDSMDVENLSASNLSDAELVALTQARTRFHANRDPSGRWQQMLHRRRSATTAIEVSATVAVGMTTEQLGGANGLK